MHERRYNPEHMAKLESPERKVSFPPEPWIEQLTLKEGTTVLRSRHRLLYGSRRRANEWNRICLGYRTKDAGGYSQ